MTRVVFGTNYPMEEARRLVAAGSYPSHHLWGTPALQAAGHDVVFIPDESLGSCSRLTSLTHRRLGNLGAQLAALKRWQPGSVVYGADPTTFAGLALLRNANLWPGPLVGVVHPGVPRGGVWAQVLRGYDVVIVLSQLMRSALIDGLGRPPETTLLATWGPDLQFPHYTRSVSGNRVVSTGKSARDTATLLAALASLNCEATVYIGEASESVAPQRVRLVQPHGVQPYLAVLEDVRSAGIVAIPYAAQDRLVGLTELADALALGISVVVTRSPLLDLDVEALGCGLTVAPGDTDGWISSISTLLAEPGRRTEMGARARAIAEEGWNADAFGQSVVSAIRLAATRARQ